MTLKTLQSPFTFPIFLPNRGPTLNTPEEFLLDQISPYSRNMEVYNNMIQGRRGLAKLLSTVLSGYVLSSPKIKLSGTHYSLFCTPLDIYKLDYTNSRYDILTPTYTTGTIEVQAGTPTILRGSGTSWNANAKAGDFVKIGSGSIHTGSTWYEVESVDSDTQITLTTSAATTAAGTAYVLRQTFSGGNTDYWDWEWFLDDNLGEIIILTNGVDTPVYWTGSGQATEFSAVPTGFISAKYVDVYKTRVVFLNTVEAGDQPQRERWSDVADSQSWDDLNFVDHAEEGTDVTGTARFAGYHVVFKERNAYVGRWVGGDDVFDYDLASECVGTNARFSIIEEKRFLGYYGSDKKFHAWNLLQDKVISEEIFDETKEFDPNYDQYIQGFNNRRKNQFRWMCPYGDTTKNNYMVVYDYSRGDEVKVWEYEEDDALCSFGEMRLTDDVYADDAIFGAQYADETLGFADEVSFLSGAPIFLYGGYDGYVRFCDSGTDDDGTDYTRLLRFKRLNFNLINQRKRLGNQQWWLEKQSSGTCTIKMRMDDNTSYESTTKSIDMTEDSDKDIIKRNVTWNKHGYTFQPEISSQYHFALLGFLNEVFPKGG